VLKFPFLCKITISEKNRKKEKKSRIFFSEHLEITVDLWYNTRKELCRFAAMQTKFFCPNAENA
jgi:hypothetical protein